MNLLVTGGAGFIGSNLIQHIIDRPEIARLVNLDYLTYAGHLANLASLAKHSKYVFEKVDVRDRYAVMGVVSAHEISHVVHLAAESHVDRSIDGPSEFVNTNVMGTVNLLEACRKAWGRGASGRKFVHVSNDDVFGSLGPQGSFTESSPYAPNSPYSASKAAGDLLVRAYYHTYEMPVVITYCANNFGPYQFPEKLIPVVIQCCLARRSIPVYGDGMNVRDWLYVRDHAEALWQVLSRGQAGESYNIGAGNERANLPVVELICDRVDELKPELGGASRKLITFVKDRPGHDRRYAVNSTKIRQELGWAPAFTFEQGIRETVRWYLDHQSWVQTVLGQIGREKTPPGSRSPASGRPFAAPGGDPGSPSPNL